MLTTTVTAIAIWVIVSVVLGFTIAACVARAKKADSEAYAQGPRRDRVIPTRTTSSARVAEQEEAE